MSRDGCGPLPRPPKLLHSLQLFGLGPTPPEKREMNGVHLGATEEEDEQAIWGLHDNDADDDDDGWDDLGSCR